MFYTDDPARDFARWDAEQNRRLRRLPRCADCGEFVQEDSYFLINDEVICIACLEHYRKLVGDYIE